MRLCRCSNCSSTNSINVFGMKLSYSNKNNYYFDKLMFIYKYINKRNTELKRICNKWYLLVEIKHNVPCISCNEKSSDILITLDDKITDNYNNDLTKICNMKYNWSLIVQKSNLLIEKYQDYNYGTKEYIDNYNKLYNILYTFKPRIDDNLHALCRYLSENYKRIFIINKYTENPIVYELLNTIRDYVLGYSNNYCSILKESDIIYICRKCNSVNKFYTKANVCDYCYNCMNRIIDNNIF